MSLIFKKIRIPGKSGPILDWRCVVQPIFNSTWARIPRISYLA